MDTENKDKLITLYYRQLNDFKYSVKADEAIGALEVLLVLVGKISPNNVLMHEFPYELSNNKILKFFGIKENHFKFIKRLTKEYIQNN